MLLTLDLTSTRPLHEQIAAAIRRAIADGQLNAGDRLPTARDIAAATSVNTNTVLRALRDLRDEGLLEFRRGRGVTVAPTATARAAMLDQVHALIQNATQHGYTRQELITLIAELP